MTTFVEAIQQAVEDTEQEMIEKACNFLARAIDEWNEQPRHKTFYLDKEGCLRNFRKAMEDE